MKAAFKKGRNIKSKVSPKYCTSVDWPFSDRNGWKALTSPAPTKPPHGPNCTRSSAAPFSSGSTLVHCGLCTVPATPCLCHALRAADSLRRGGPTMGVLQRGLTVRIPESQDSPLHQFKAKEHGGALCPPRTAQWCCSGHTTGFLPEGTSP